MPSDPQRPAATNPTPLRKPASLSGTPCSLGEAAAAWSGRRGQAAAGCAASGGLRAVPGHGHCGLSSGTRRPVLCLPSWAGGGGTREALV